MSDDQQVLKTITVASNGKTPPKVTVRVETITAKRAVQILDDNNVRNRDIRDQRVAALALTLRRNEWELTGDCICFDWDGVLLNGQHRLSACAVTGIPITVVVLRNLAPKSQDVMDGNLVRRLGDALRLRGEKDQHKLAATINFYSRLTLSETTGSLHHGGHVMGPSIPMLLKLYDQHPGLKQATSRMQPVIKRLRLRPGPTCGLYYRFYEIDAEDADFFFEALKTGAGLDEGSPILALRRYCEGELARPRGKVSEPQWVAVAIKAWNYFRDGREVRLVTFKPGGMSPEAWPVAR